MYLWFCMTLSVFCLILVQFSIISNHRKSSWSFVLVIIYCAGAGISTLTSNFDKLDPYTFRRKMEKTRSVNEEMDGKMFIARQSRHLSLSFIWIKYFSLLCTLTWRVNKYVSHRGESINRTNESTAYRSLISVWLSRDCTDCD